MDRTAIIGFGGGGYHAAKALREADADAVIDVYTDTADAPANPMLTTYYVGGRITRDTQMPYGTAKQIARQLGLNLFVGVRVQKLRARERTIILPDGSERTYDDIVLATGSHPLVPPIKGLPDNREGIYVMRTMADADRLLAALQKGIQSAVVIGASWVGIKAVEALFAHGVPTVLADMSPRIFPTATLPDVAEIIHQRLTDMGIRLKFGAGISSIRKENGQLVSAYSDGTEEKSEIIILCMGLRPTVDIVDPAEFDMGRGILVDLKMRTSVPHIYAVGDCCEAYEMITGQPMVVNLWANAFTQGEVAGKNIANIPAEFQGNFIHNITHFLGMDFIGLGDNRAPGKQVVYRQPKEGWSFYAIISDGRINCVNVLDNHKVSGPAKAALIRCLTTKGEVIGPAARLALQQSGLPAEIIAKIGGY